MWIELMAVKIVLKGVHATQYSQAHIKMEEFRKKLAAI